MARVDSAGPGCYVKSEPKNFSNPFKTNGFPARRLPLPISVAAILAVRLARVKTVMAAVPFAAPEAESISQPDNGTINDGGF
jgi:hypothetical protein